MHDKDENNYFFREYPIQFLSVGTLQDRQENLVDDTLGNKGAPRLSPPAEELAEQRSRIGHTGAANAHQTWRSITPKGERTKSKMIEGLEQDVDFIALQAETN